MLRCAPNGAASHPTFCPSDLPVKNLGEGGAVVQPVVAENVKVRWREQLALVNRARFGGGSFRGVRPRSSRETVRWT
jgi:hypothetical protein